ncbi:hypothetical protein ACSSS7_003270 [Eimeria intestinalis]
MADVPESWEDVVDELEEPAPPPPPPKQKSSPTKAKPSPQSARKKFQEEEDFLDDPVAERLRRERLVEESEKRLVDDFFAGCERPDAPPTAKDTAEDSHKAHISARASKALAGQESRMASSVGFVVKGMLTQDGSEGASKRMVLDRAAAAPAAAVAAAAAYAAALIIITLIMISLLSLLLIVELIDSCLFFFFFSQEEEEDYDDDVPDDGGDEFI